MTTITTIEHLFTIGMVLLLISAIGGLMAHFARLQRAEFVLRRTSYMLLVSVFFLVILRILVS